VCLVRSASGWKLEYGHRDGLGSILDGGEHKSQLQACRASSTAAIKTEKRRQCYSPTLGLLVADGGNTFGSHSGQMVEAGSGHGQGWAEETPAHERTTSVCKMQESGSREARSLIFARFPPIPATDRPPSGSETTVPPFVAPRGQRCFGAHGCS
jgi:hypothetical protein